MPVYQYACTECGERLEVRQSFTDAALTECPACAGRLRKVLSPVGVVFKGSGFYRTDSRAAANGTSDSSSSSSSKEGSKDGAANGSKSLDGKKSDAAATSGANSGGSGSSSEKAASTSS